MKIAVIGLGVQGRKRKDILGNYCTSTVDPYSNLANYKRIEDVPLNSFDAAFVCTPDSVKLEIIEYLVRNRKHVLCEKPLSLSSSQDFDKLEILANHQKIALYTAYNHNFEGSIKEAKEIIADNFLGHIYQIRIFYGNGTAQLVSNSDWRDTGLGIIPDLGSHCIGIIKYWFPDLDFTLKLANFDKFETKAPDNAILISTESYPRILIELSFCSWKNNFQAEIVGKNGSIGIYGLSKWGESKLITQQRILPSGIPTENIRVFESGDKTWSLEQNYFFDLITRKSYTTLTTDKFIYEKLKFTEFVKI